MDDAYRYGPRAVQGAGPALTALVAGQVQLVCTSPLAALPFVRDGRLRGLAMTSRTRSQAAPDTPTVAESGVPGYESTLWYALLAPAGTPKPIIKRLHAETVRIIHLPTSPRSCGGWAPIRLAAVRRSFQNSSRPRSRAGPK